MNFLYSGFLFALFAVAIPVIIHLFNFRKFKKVYFSNVAFLKEIKEQNSSREKLKNLLILCCRILAIAFLVLAFARPFLPSATKIDQSKGNSVSIYLDNSYSMDAVNKEGSLLDEAKRKAREVVKAFQINDRFQLLTNDFEGKHQRLLNGDEALQAIDEVKISSASRKLPQVLNRQQSVFTGISNRFLYVISDFQKGFSGDEMIKTDENIHISLGKLNANNLPNVAVDSVWLLSPMHQVNATEKLVVQLRNYGDEEAKNIPIKLTINKQQKAISSLTVEAGKTKRDTLSFSGLSLGWQKGTVSLKDFPLTFDDDLNFSFKVNAEQKIVSIYGKTDEKYIKTLFEADSYFKLTEMPEANINYSSLQGYNLVVLNGLNSPSSGLAQELKSYVSNGGSVVIFPNLNAEKNVYTAFLTALNLPAVAELNTTLSKVSSIELKHPLFKDVFETLPQNIDLPQVNRYFSFSESNTRNIENLLQLPAGKLFFARYPSGNGQIYLSATDLANEDSNFAKHPVFVPLMYKIAFASAKEQPIYYTAMKDNVLETQKIELGANQSLKLVADNFEVIPELRQTNGKTLLYVADQVKKAGFYDVKKGDSTLAIVAFNDNRAESNMHYTSQADLQKLFGKQQITFLDPKSDSIASAVGAKNNGTELWKLCLILTLVFLAIEIILVRFYHIRKPS
ncbi:BatA domain-containing protein [Pedobacter boryungensis]|uniref:BatA domain-containing protein n=1 Tax=Pedobacter boryungensis TaxID=869962 RepID=A0ABX2D8F9_9SPHI|nr:BatA and WFA domain-containing protein [Pedobacter boryungensis]NQX30335.1 BatA domain-containing protein [Pedobacter boryungensis]